MQTLRHLPVASMDLVPPGMMRWLPIILIIPSCNVHRVELECSINQIVAAVKTVKLSAVAASKRWNIADT